MEQGQKSNTCKRFNFAFLYSTKNANLASTSREVQKDINVCSSDMNKNSDYFMTTHMSITFISNSGFFVLAMSMQM